MMKTVKSAYRGVVFQRGVLRVLRSVGNRFCIVFLLRSLRLSEATARSENSTERMMMRMRGRREETAGEGCVTLCATVGHSRTQSETEDENESERGRIRRKRETCRNR